MGRLRPRGGGQRGGVDVCRGEGGLVWLRGRTLDESLHRQLRSVLGCRVFRRMDDGQLVGEGAAVPTAREPAGPWTPLTEWVELSLPRKRFTAKSPAPVAISLVRSTQAKPSRLLRMPLDLWIGYARAAPRVRLSRLTFAAGDEWVVVTGDPLPPLPGEFFHVEHGIAAPAGFAWRPALDARVLSQSFGLSEGDIALMTTDGAVSVIRSDQFVGATRSAAKLTQGADGGRL